MVSIRPRPLLALAAALALAASVTALVFRAAPLREGPAPDDRSAQRRSTDPPAPQGSSLDPAAEAGRQIPVEPDVLDREVALRAATRWMRSRLAADARLLDAQEVLDCAGDPASLTVVYGTDPQLRDRGALAEVLAIHAIGEREAKADMAAAARAGDRERAGRLAQRVQQSRRALIETYGLMTCKVSLSRSLPPVLSFWRGLPFEVVRHGAARRLAEQALGRAAASHQLIKFTAVSSLIRFHAADGRSVCVDPVNLRLVSLDALRHVTARARRREDPARDERIRRQWAEFLPAPDGQEVAGR